jgi:hypothetical protein
VLVLRKEILQLFRHPEAEFKKRIESDTDAANAFIVAQNQLDLRS